MIKQKIVSCKVKAQSGFVALLSVVIISVVMLIIATNLSLTGFYVRSNILDSELKLISSVFAEACVDTALLKITNSDYSNGSVNVDGVSGEDCSYSINGGNIKTISAQGVYKSLYYTNLEVDVNSSTVIVSRWEEVPN